MVLWTPGGRAEVNSKGPVGWVLGLLKESQCA